MSDNNPAKDFVLDEGNPLHMKFLKAIKDKGETTMSAMAEMPKYKCYKEVWALKIAAIKRDDKFPDGDYDAGDREEPGATITPEEVGYAPFHVSAQYMRKHRPEVGGYFVVYEDGYQSYSPGKAFEDGYARLSRASSSRAEVESAAARDVLVERRRQVEAEGWTPEHDDEHIPGTLSQAAGCYIEWNGWESEFQREGAIPVNWPWAAEWWKPSDDRRNLVKAGALILAEIERIDRLAAAEAGDAK